LAKFARTLTSAALGEGRSMSAALRIAILTHSTNARGGAANQHAVHRADAQRPVPTNAGKRIPGLKLDHPRQLALMHALVRFAHIAAGNTFTTAEIHPALRRSARLHPRPLYARFAPLRPPPQGIDGQTNMGVIPK
jgi:hypothetical protein